MTRFVMLLLLPAAALAATPPAAPTAPSPDGDSDVSNTSFVAALPPSTKPAPAKAATDQPVTPAPTMPAATKPAEDQDVSSVRLSGKPDTVRAVTTTSAPVAPTVVPAPAQPAPAGPATTARSLLPPFVRHYQFKGETIDSVISVLIRDYNCPIVLDADSTTLVTGSYSATSLNSILQLICADANLQYDRKEGTIYIRGPQSKTGLAKIGIADLERLSLADDAQPKTPPPSISSVDANKLQTLPGATNNPDFLPKLVASGKGKDQFANIARKRAKLLEERTTLLASGP